MSKGKVNFWWYLIFFIVGFAIFAGIWLGVDYASNNKALTSSSVYHDLFLSAVLSLISTIGFYIQNRIALKKKES